MSPKSKLLFVKYSPIKDKTEFIGYTNNYFHFVKYREDDNCKNKRYYII